jgi:uncharacterized membrane protein YciS (DUF1049 family)
MRYLSLALAALFAILFFAMSLPPLQDTSVKFLSASIQLPISSLTNLSYLLGVFTGLFLAIFILSLRQKASNTSVATQVRAST